MDAFRLAVQCRAPRCTVELLVLQLQSYSMYEQHKIQSIWYKSHAIQRISIEKLEFNCRIARVILIAITNSLETTRDFSVPRICWFPSKSIISRQGQMCRYSWMIKLKLVNSVLYTSDYLDQIQLLGKLIQPVMLVAGLPQSFSWNHCYCREFNAIFLTDFHFTSEHYTNVRHFLVCKLWTGNAFSLFPYCAATCWSNTRIIHPTTIYHVVLSFFAY